MTLEKRLQNVRETLFETHAKLNDICDECESIDLDPLMSSVSEIANAYLHIRGVEKRLNRKVVDK